MDILPEILTDAGNGKKYGEGYRNTIKQQVEEEHKKGRSPEEAEKNVKENMDDIENEYYIHGRSRRG